MRFRIGVNQGDVIHDEARIYGDGVNVAARLESVAERGRICISAKVRDEIAGKTNVACQDFGTHQLKNIAYAERVYRIELDEALRNPLRIEKPTLVDPTGHIVYTKGGHGVFAFAGDNSSCQPRIHGCRARITLVNTMATANST